MAKTYIYKAFDKTNNKKVSGQMEANNETSLDKLLNENGLVLIKADEIKSQNLFSFMNRISVKDLIVMFVTLEQLERAGVSLLDSVKDIRDFAGNPKLKNIGQDLFESLKNGLLLSQAMEKHSKVFDPISISLVAMGEKTGNLDTSFHSIIDNIKWAHEIKRKIIKSIQGPILLLILLFVIVIVLLKVVVPNIISFVIEQDFSISSMTTSLISTAKFVENHISLILLFPIIVFLTIKMLCRIEKISYIVDTIKLKLPIFGPLIQKIELSRFAKFFGLTFSAGISVVDCIDVTKKVIQNKRIKEELEIMRSKIINGSTMAKAISESGYFSHIVIRMFKIGEDSGDMETSLKNINYFYDTEVNDTIEIVISSIKPAVLFIVGGLIFWIIAGVFGPLYGNFGNLM